MFFPVVILAGDLDAVDTDLREVSSGGYWSFGNEEGFLRFIVLGGGIDHYKTRLYVQWLTIGTDYEKSKIYKSVSIHELNESPVYSFGLPKCIGKSACRSISINAKNTYDLSEHLIQIQLTEPGNYVYKSKAL